MEFGKAFTYPFEDQEWLKKMGIAGLVMLIPLLGQIIVSGWGLATTRNVIQDDPQPLADWSDFGGHLVNGLKVFVVGFVYALPIILISACPSILLAFLDSSDDTIMSVFSVVSICISCFSIIYGIFLGLVLPAAIARLAVSGQMGDAFRFGDVFGLVRAAPAAYLIVLLGGILAGIVAMFGIILCVIGMVFTIAYAYAVNSHFYGQAYNVAMGSRELQSV